MKYLSLSNIDKSENLKREHLEVGNKRPFAVLTVARLSLLLNGLNECNGTSHNTFNIQHIPYKFKQCVTNVGTF